MDSYRLYLDGEFYGEGDLDYIHQLITEYMLIRGIYSKEKVEFKILKSDD
ncbi:hypothetical protein U0E09_32995 [Bacillus thuringiensis]|nr:MULTISPECIES: hypothetical protein [Bacillus]MDY7954844.1 hypothetical protein [Bacillus thuringiensis]